MSMVWDWHVPDLYEIQRAQEFIGWAYEGGTETAVEMYEQKYGNRPNCGAFPCWVKDEPDMGLLTAVNALWKITRAQQLQNPT